MDRFAERTTPEGLPSPGNLALENIGIKIVEEHENRSNRIKYTHVCRESGKPVSVWSKPSLNISCGDCGLGYEPT